MHLFRKSSKSLVAPGFCIVFDAEVVASGASSEYKRTFCIWPHFAKIHMVPCGLHTKSFDRFLSGLEWIPNFEFYLVKLLTFYLKLLRNIRFSLNSSTFWVFRPLFEACFTINEDFDQIYVNAGSKSQNVGKLSLDVIFYNHIW